MSKSKEYRDIKNFIHNELGVSKQVLVDLIKDELRHGDDARHGNDFKMGIEHSIR